MASFQPLYFTVLLFYNESSYLTDFCARWASFVGQTADGTAVCMYMRSFAECDSETQAFHSWYGPQLCERTDTAISILEKPSEDAKEVETCRARSDNEFCCVVDFTSPHLMAFVVGCSRSAYFCVLLMDVSPALRSVLNMRQDISSCFSPSLPVHFRSHSCCNVVF